ncbi:hypothetical protein GG344DRAFT_70766 [Lentinula edodes]|nr:hypothetical protein GG344DRAFT_70766 [Lentinula edodes]
MSRRLKLVKKQHGMLQGNIEEIKNKEEYNQASKLRMHNEHGKLSNNEAEADAKERHKMSAKKYYLKNREAILAKAEHKRVKAYVSKHNNAEWAYFAYPARKYNL